MQDNHKPNHKGKRLFRLVLAAGLLGGQSVLRRLVNRERPQSSLETNDPSKTALITGASGGIGAAFARRLASLGYNLILVARREQRLAALASQLQQSYPVSAEFLVADLSKTAGITRVERRIAELESLHVLINNAGFGAPGQFVEEANLHKYLDMIHVHVIASTRLCRAALPQMIAQHNGRIINVSSLAAFMPVPGSATYSASKAYLNVFSGALQAELRGTGIKVQALCPGFTHTEFHDTPEYQGYDRSEIPELLWMSAEEVAAQSLNALDRNQVIFVPGFKNRLLATVARRMPPSLLQSLRSLRNRPI